MSVCIEWRPGIQGCVDLPVTAHCDEPAIGRMDQGLGIHFAGPELLRRQRHRNAVLDGSIWLKSARLIAAASAAELQQTSAFDDGRDHLVVLGPDQLARGIHGHRGLFATQFDHHDSIIEPNRDALLSLLVCDAPSSFQAIVERLFKAIGVGVPYPDRSVLGARDDDGELRVVAGKADVVGVALAGKQLACCNERPGQMAGPTAWRSGTLWCSPRP